MTPSEFLEQFIERNIQVICLTDHSTGEWADKVRTASKRKPITVFPGFEVTINGIHFTAIFPEKTTTSRLHEILVGFGIVETHRGKRDTVCDEDTTLKSFSSAVHADGGLVIAAHCLSPKDGLMGHQKRLGRSMFENFLPFIDILEIKPHQESTRLEEYWTSINGQYRGRKLPIIKGSDAHSPDEIVDASCFVSMAKPTFQSLKQILVEPESRVMLNEVRYPHYPRITRVSTSSQKLGGIDIDFSPHLNTIIGGRGSGKSATLDLLRWTLNSLPSHPATKDSILSRIQGFLGENFSSTVEYEVGGKRFRAHRSGGAELPDLEQWVSNEWVPSAEVAPLSVDFYSQGEASRLSDIGSEHAQLILIDNLGNTKGLKQSIEEIIEQLLMNAEGVTKVLSDLSQQQALEQNLKKLKEDAKKWSSILKSSAFEDQRKWNAANAWVSSAFDKMTLPDGALIEPFEQLLPISPEYPESNLLTEFVETFAVMEEIRSSTEQSLRSRLKEASNTLPGLKLQWDKSFAEAKVKYEKELQKMEGADIANQDVLNSQLSKTEQDINDLESRISDLSEVQERYEDLKKHRSLLLNTLDDARKALFDERTRIAEQISANLPSLQIAIEEAADLSIVKAYFGSLFTGSGLHNRESVISALAHFGKPREIANFIEQNDSHELSSAFGITASAAQKLKTTVDPEKLLELETLACDDIPRISLRKGNSGLHEPLKRLSAGQRCSAILAIALMDHDRPLVIDQPEDELDHKYIVEEIVETIRKSKSSRQLIMATHNPNIPVLGDAELVVKVEELDGICHVDSCGGLEEPEIIAKVQDLDGGRAAFERRRERYA